MLSYPETWVLAMAALLGGRPPSEWPQAIPLADAQVTQLLEMAGIPRPGGLHPAEEEVRLDQARAQATRAPRPSIPPRKTR
jgi:hypothetical protein